MEPETPGQPIYTTERNPRLRLLIPLVVACALVMESLDQTIITTAIPQLAQSLDESPLRLNVAITSYLLSLALFIPVSGWIADRYGARKVFCAALAVFTIGSALCGAATSLPMLIATRILQGLGGALMTPVGRLVLLKSFPKSELVKALNYVAIPALLGPALGPLVGGALTTYVSWRWTFFINIPVGILGIVLALRYFDDFRAEAVSRFDFLGFILCGVGLAATELLLEYAGRRIISTGAEAALLGTAVLCLGTYGIYARHKHNPAVDLKIFRIKTFRIGVIGGGICRMGLGSTPFLLPLLLQLPLGFTAFQSGLATSVMAVGTIAVRTNSISLFRRWGFRNILLSNGALLTLGLAGLALITEHTPIALVVIGLLFLGVFRSMQFTTMNSLCYSDLPRAEISPGTSVSSVVQQLSQSFGIAISATMLALMSGSSDHPTSAEFGRTFLVMAIPSLASLLWFARLSVDDGASVAGYIARPKEPR